MAAAYRFCAPTATALPSAGGCEQGLIVDRSIRKLAAPLDGRRVPEESFFHVAA